MAPVSMLRVSIRSKNKKTAQQKGGRIHAACGCGSLFRFVYLEHEGRLEQPELLCPDWQQEQWLSQ